MCLSHLFKAGYSWGMQRKRSARVPRWVDMLNDIDFEEFMLGVERAEQEIV